MVYDRPVLPVAGSPKDRHFANYRIIESPVFLVKWRNGIRRIQPEGAADLQLLLLGHRSLMPVLFQAAGWKSARLRLVRTHQ